MIPNRADLRDPKSDTQPTQPQRQVQKQNVESEPVVAASSSKVETPKVSMEEATRMLDERMSKFFDMIMSSKKDSEATSSKKKKKQSSSSPEADNEELNASHTRTRKAESAAPPKSQKKAQNNEYAFANGCS